MSGPRVPDVGDTVEDVAVMDSTGARRRLSSLAAPGLLLVFFRGNW